MMSNYKKGFTLIELLVVVLIIAILAAVAVAQYNKAVEKSKAAQALTLLRTVANAYNAYYLANGQYPTDFTQLDVEIPWTGNTKFYTANWPTRSNEDWSLQISTYSGRSIFIGRIKGPYAGAGFTIYKTETPHTNVPLNKLVCVEGHTANGVFQTFPQTQGNYCEKIMGGSLISTTTANRYFRL